MRLTCLALALAACKPAEDPLPTSPALPVDGGAVVRVEISTVQGEAPLIVPLRAVNAFGVPTATTSHSVVVDGTATTVSFDGYGYGEVVLDEVGTHTLSNGIRQVEVHVMASSWPGLGLDPAVQAPDGGDPAVEAMALSNGLLVRGSRTVWFLSPTQPPYVVLELPFGTLGGLRTGNLDGDGITDALVWSESQVFALRGRPAGGVGWGTAVEAPGYLTAGAAIGDVSGDSLPDLVVGWTDEGDSHWVDVWEGNGLWDFSAASPPPLLAEPTGVGVGNNTGESLPQITAANSLASWERFVKGDSAGYLPVGPQLDVGTPDSAAVLDGSDLNGDGGDELMFVSPLQPGVERELLIFDLVGDEAEFLTLRGVAAHYQIVDTNADGLEDVMQLPESGVLQSISYQSGILATRQGATDLDHAPFAMADFTGDDDRIPELLTAGEGLWRWHRGATNEADGERWWRIEDPVFAEAGVRIDQSIVLTELDGDANTIDAVSFEVRIGRTYLKGWSRDHRTGTTTIWGEVIASQSGAQPVDLAVCDGIAWALMTGELARIDLNGTTPIVTATMETTAKRLDCGNGPSNSKVTLLDGSGLEYLDNALNSLGTLPLAGAEDVAVQSGEVSTCGESQCTIEGFEGPWGPRFVSGGSSIVVSDGEEETILGAAGQPGVADIDGDGIMDVVVASEGTVSVFRGTDTSWGAAEVYHLNVDLSGPPLVADLTGDGAADVVLVLDTSEIVYSVDPLPWAPQGTP